MISLHFAKSIPLPIDPTIKDSDLLIEAARETLRQAGSPVESDLTIVITDDHQLQALNRQFLGIDAPTDVLSFPTHEADPETGDVYLGDILISYPQAIVQSHAGGHSIQDELQLLVVHGVLHLLGYDHAQDAERERMWAVQADTLQYLGCSILRPGPAPD